MDSAVALKDMKKMSTSNRSASRVYDEEFKRRAVEMTLTGKGPTEVARELGIPRSCLTRWKKTYLEKADAISPAGAVKPSEQDAEIRRLRQENAYIHEQNLILKKTIGIMAQAPRSTTIR